MRETLQLFPQVRHATRADVVQRTTAEWRKPRPEEETGIEVEIYGLLDTVDFAVTDEGGSTVTWRLAMFYGRYLGGSPKPGSDAAGVGWVRLEDLEKLRLTEGTAALIGLAAGRIRAAGA